MTARTGIFRPATTRLSIKSN